LYDFVPFRPNQQKKKSLPNKNLLKAITLKQQNKQAMSPKTRSQRKLLKDKQSSVTF